MTRDEMVAAVIAQGGFDSTTTGSTTAEIVDWVQDRYRRMVADSRWRKAQVAIGNTVAGQAEYALDVSIVDIEAILIGTQAYEVVGPRELWDLKAQNSIWVGLGGVVAADFTAAGAPQIEMYPPPTTSGDAISGFAALLPVDLAAGDSPIVPVDFHQGIVDGAIATGLLRADERADLAGPYEQSYAAHVGRLSHRAQNRVGGGPAQILVKGYHW